MAKEQRDALSHHSEHLDSAVEHIIRECKPDRLSADQLRQKLDQIIALVKSLAVSAQASCTGPTTESFVECLGFPEMADREQSIPASHVKTFEWILSSAPEQSGVRISPQQDVQNHIAEKLQSMGLDEHASQTSLRLQEHDTRSALRLQEWFKSGNGVL